MRELNRNLDFRRGVSKAIDRRSTRQGAGWRSVHRHLSGRHLCRDVPSTTRTRRSTIPYRSLESAKATSQRQGRTDTDGNGFLNFPAGTAGGGDVEITLLTNGDYQTDKTIGETLVAMLERVGLRVIPNTLDGPTQGAPQLAGKFDGG